MGVKLGYKQSREHLSRRMAAKAATLSHRPKPFTKEWLTQKYVTEHLDCVQIGLLASRDPKTIWLWLRYYQIPTRPRGHNVGQLPKGRAPGFTLSERHRQQLREARLRDGHVPYLVNGVHAMKGRTGSAHPSWKGGATPERQSFYGSEEWKVAVKIVWARADAQCERCAIHHNTRTRRGTFHIHHIVSFTVRSLRAQPSNLVLLCKPCHLFVHSKKNASKEFIREERYAGA